MLRGIRRLSHPHIGGSRAECEYRIGIAVTVLRLSRGVGTAVTRELRLTPEKMTAPFQRFALLSKRTVLRLPMESMYIGFRWLNTAAMRCIAYADFDIEELTPLSRVFGIADTRK